MLGKVHLLSPGPRGHTVLRRSLHSSGVYVERMGGPQSKLRAARLCLIMHHPLH